MRTVRSTGGAVNAAAGVPRPPRDGHAIEPGTANQQCAPLPDVAAVGGRGRGVDPARAATPATWRIAIAVVALVTETHRHESRIARALPVLLARRGHLLRCCGCVLVLLTTHIGAEAFATVPEATLPRLLGGFTVGGSLEWAVLWQAVAEGFVVIGVMAAFGGFNALASHHELVQRLPRAFHEAGVVLTVALAFVPSTLVAVGQVREADRARTGGRLVRRGRLVRLVVPVLELGLERAVNLAESMDARGFGRGPTGAPPGRVGLARAGRPARAVRRDGRPRRPGVGRGAGLPAGRRRAALVAALVLAGADERVTRYRVRSLTRHRPRRARRGRGRPRSGWRCAAPWTTSSLRWVVGAARRAVPTFRLLPGRAAAAPGRPGARSPRPAAVADLAGAAA